MLIKMHIVKEVNLWHFTILVAVSIQHGQSYKHRQAEQRWKLLNVKKCLLTRSSSGGVLLVPKKKVSVFI